MINQEEMFLFNSIRKYNRAQRQTQQDVVLHAVGVKAKLLEKRRSPLPELTPAERELVLNHLSDFCKAQGVEILLKSSNSPVTYQ